MQTLANAADRESVLRRIGTLQPTSQRKWGRMSVHQMICHLNDSFLVGLGEREARFIANPLTRTLVKWVALHAPFNWPKGTPTMPEIDQSVGGTPPVEFERDRAELLNLVGRFCDSCRASRRLYMHPFFGELRQDEWLRWGFLHADHHLRQFGA